MPTKDVKEKNIIDSVMYRYSTSANPYEEENRILKETVSRLRDELERYKATPLMVCEVKEMIKDNAIIKIPNGNQFLVNISAECEKLRAGDLILVEQKNLTVIRKVPITKKFNIEKFVIVEKPTISWGDVGGLNREMEEIKEVVELPLKKPELFRKIGITPPKGILLYGEPGTGKTLLAKAVASSTNSTFIQVVGSELVQKFIGEGAKLVKEIFEYARRKAPAIVFIDELDALAAKRVEVGTSGEREVNRTFMQLLAELDGFKPLDNVKIIGATNRKDILDTAIIRPGRLDRLIHVPLPTNEARLDIFKIHTRAMSFSKNISLESLVERMDNFSGAEIKAVCTEAGYFAIRFSREHVIKDDFLKAIEKVRQSEKLEGSDYMGMFG
jgi:proteasome regulatory subunit